MGGVKKRSISKVEKARSIDRKKEMGRDTKGPVKKVKKDIAMPNIDEEQAIKMFRPMKAVTVYNTAKALNIKASVASALLRNLESKGILKKFGGYSGHFVYTIVDVKKS
ncbi:MAG: hypothetical protein L6M37_03740 [Candidatus Methylarchaceae archaeon HK02M1]|nr:hypothetical protein [Candidatus Methylarchaceae archaeon HK01M]MCP8312050.1 hypothetical protein [Candidatus Methylarchaceae archaeon HK02M1]